MAIGTPLSLGTASAIVSGTTVSLTVSAAVPTGSHIIAIAGCANFFVNCTFSDSKGNTWGLDTQAVGSANENFFIGSAIVTSALTTSDTITATFDLASVVRMLAACSVTGLSNVGWVDTGSAFSAGTVAWNSGTSPTTNQADELIIGGCYNNSTAAETSTPDGPQIELWDFSTASATSLTGTYRIVSATGAYTVSGTWTNSGTRAWEAGSITYRAATGIGGGPPGSETAFWNEMGPSMYTGPSPFNEILMFQAPSTGLFQANLTATVGSTVTFLKSIGKFFTANTTATPSVVKSVVKVFTATANNTAQVTKSVGKNTTATLSVAASATKSVGKNLSANISSSASLIKLINKAFTATVASIASLTALKAVLLTLTATQASVASLSKSVIKPFTSTVGSASSLSKQIGKNFTSTVANSATLGALKAVLLVLGASVATSASITRNIGTNLTASLVSTVSVLKNIAKSFSAPVTAAASLVATFKAAGGAAKRLYSAIVIGRF